MVVCDVRYSKVDNGFAKVIVAPQLEFYELLCLNLR